MDNKQSNKFKQLLVSGVAGICVLSMMQKSWAETELTAREDVKSFISELVSEHDFSAEFVNGLFEQVKLLPNVISAMKRPYEAKPWGEYKNLFITQSHISNGLAFYKAHRATLDRAEKEFGVPAEVITAIIGVETRYGTHMGRHSVLDSLATLAFDYPPRSKFFRSELIEFLKLSQEQSFDPTSLKGSYAGAMGAPQFISSSYRHYAIDYSGDGKKDLLNNIDDAIGSVANYFKQHGWKSNQPVVFETSASNTIEGLDELIASRYNPKPNHRLSTLASKGFAIPSSVSNSTDVALIKLKDTDGDKYFLGLNNFYVITRYNHSNLYGMAVHQLSQRIKSALSEQDSYRESGRPFVS